MLLLKVSFSCRLVEHTDPGSADQSYSVSPETQTFREAQVTWLSAASWVHCFEVEVFPSRVAKTDKETKAQRAKRLAPGRLVAWGPGSAKGGSRELRRICIKELAHSGQAGQLVALHVLHVHAVKQEGAIQVLDKCGLWLETQLRSTNEVWWVLSPRREAGQDRSVGIKPGTCGQAEVYN